MFTNVATYQNKPEAKCFRSVLSEITFGISVKNTKNASRHYSYDYTKEQKQKEKDIYIDKD